MDGPSPGWYPDPWASGHHRYWDGTAWTGDAFPNGPVDPSDPHLPPPALPRVAPPPPQWAATPTAVLPQVPVPEPPTTPGPLSTGLGFVALVVVMMLVVGSLAVVGAYYTFGGGSKERRAAAPVTPVTPTRPLFPGIRPTPTPTTPAAPTDPSAAVLSGLVVTQADVAATSVVQTDSGGNGVGEPTLDLCSGTYPSESSRTARLQVSAYDFQLSRFLSTEAVLYSGPADTTQAFSELKSVAAACPATSTTHFNAAPDAAWPAVATVDRAAYDLTETDSTGTAQHIVAVYLRRGRVLMGIYFGQPDGTQQAVAGQTTLAGITNVFANRMAQLPASVTG